MDEQSIQAMMEEVKRLREENARLRAQLGQPRADGKMTKAQWDQEKQYASPGEWKAADDITQKREAARLEAVELWRRNRLTPQQRERMMRDRIARPGTAFPSPGLAST